MRIGIVGGGPSALFMLKRIVESNRRGIIVTIFEKKDKLGCGMPYSDEGACGEHITNVSGNEIPELVTTVEDWVGMNGEAADHYHVSVKNFNDYKVLPRLLFGEYLSQQFDFLLAKAKRHGMAVDVHFHTEIVDIAGLPDLSQVEVLASGGNTFRFDKVVVCSGHYWPKPNEGKVSGYFDSPYPPQKLRHIVNQTVAIRGASLTAIDALRTLAVNNGRFVSHEHGRKGYLLNADCGNFKIILHSRNGLLPAVRFHLEDSHLSKDSVLTAEEIARVRGQNGGYDNIIAKGSDRMPLSSGCPVYVEH